MGWLVLLLVVPGRLVDTCCCGQLKNCVGVAGAEPLGTSGAGGRKDLCTLVGFGSREAVVDVGGCVQATGRTDKRERWSTDQPVTQR